MRSWRALPTAAVRAAAPAPAARAEVALSSNQSGGTYNGVYGEYGDTPVLDFGDTKREGPLQRRGLRQTPVLALPGRPLPLMRVGGAERVMEEKLP